MFKSLNIDYDGLTCEVLVSDTKFSIRYELDNAQYLSEVYMLVKAYNDIGQDFIYPIYSFVVDCVRRGGYSKFINCCDRLFNRARIANYYCNYKLEDLNINLSELQEKVLNIHYKIGVYE
jgi:hypothetical protein